MFSYFLTVNSMVFSYLLALTTDRQALKNPSNYVTPCAHTLHFFVVSGVRNAVHARADKSVTWFFDGVESFFGYPLHFRSHFWVVLENFMEIARTQDECITRRGCYHARDTSSVCEKTNF